MDGLPPGAVTDAPTRVLLALVAEYQQTGHATFRSVARRAHRQVATVYWHCVWLRTLGFADWEDGKRGTLRPLVGAVA